VPVNKKTSYVIKHFAGSPFLIAYHIHMHLNPWLCQGRLYVTIGLIMATLNYSVMKPHPGLLTESPTLDESTNAILKHKIIW